MPLEMREELRMLRRLEKRPAFQLSSVVWWQTVGRSPGLERRSPSWDGTSVITLGRKSPSGDGDQTAEWTYLVKPEW